jgi:hypothetical protein
MMPDYGIGFWWGRISGSDSRGRHWLVTSLIRVKTGKRERRIPVVMMKV